MQCENLTPHYPDMQAILAKIVFALLEKFQNQIEKS
jgi:hypothetical protein